MSSWGKERPHGTGSSAPSSVMTQEGGPGGREAHEGGVCGYTQRIHVVMQWKLTQHCKATIFNKRF